MKAHSLHKLLASLYGKPHLISKDAFQSVSSYLNSRNAGLISFPDDSKEKAEKQPTFDTNSGIGVLTIRGSLTYRATGWEGLCGGYSYESLLADATEMVEAGIKTIVIDADSGGGEAYGCFEVSNEFAKLCSDNEVKTFGYVDGTAASAMYGLICVCDEVVANPYAEVGSIGVLIALQNDSEYLKQKGIERIFITDGTEKVPFADDGSFRKGFIEDLEVRCAELGDAFRSHVSAYTGLSVADLKATNAKVYSAQAALDIGLINKIQTRSEFISYVVDKHKGV
jgi:ClpP class serine protease